MQKCLICDEDCFKGIIWAVCEILKCDGDIELAEQLLKKSGLILKIKDKNIEIYKANKKILKKFGFI